MDSKAMTAADIIARAPRPFFKRAFAAPTADEPKEAAKCTDAPIVANTEEKFASGLLSALARPFQRVEPALPAVVSVKKSSKGCAVVILRDPQVIERCVLQRVAVVDGVCVEMKRHSKRSKTRDADGDEVDDQEPASGIFCAWGNRVERRVPVSEEGLEEFFNSLAGQPMPDGLIATPPFEEGHISFQLSSSTSLPFTCDARKDEANRDKLLNSRHCPKDTIQALWDAKGRIDELWNRPPPPMARSVISRVARAQLFPHSSVGGQEHENRAGDKMAEIVEVVGLLDGVPRGAAFLDLCGGPGAWSQHLLGHKDLALRGFGFTLKASAGSSDDWQAEEKDEWYDDLYDHPDWTALWGADGTGDLLKPGNLEHAAHRLATEKVLLCVADGGFSDDAIPANQLELYFSRLFLAEILMAVSCLKPGGKFVCKLYTTFSDATAGLLWATTRFFDSVKIVKPMSSRATGPERYLAADGFRCDPSLAPLRAALLAAHKCGGGASPLSTPLLTPLISAENLVRDDAFASSMRKMVTTMCERQTLALNAVVDRADFLENLAMDCATCTQAFTRPQRPRQDDCKRDERRRDRDGASRHERHQAREDGARGPKSKGKGKGKGKGKFTNTGTSRSTTANEGTAVWPVSLTAMVAPAFGYLGPRY
eukprot:TRINITY_DN468_c0_g2_i1.p1 TRINITY_DN468_c0_g2~~TRINITY_DN468_c0_g2_i1.p1  ORF type:complete len:710 (-),score=103.20 TRINITY_DN468_c0_g2_i1:379-2334(-)